jgi:hypothetical protein
MKINKIFLITIIIYSVSAMEEEKQNATGYHKLISDVDFYCKNTLGKGIETKSLFESIKQLITLNAEKKEKDINMKLSEVLFNGLAVGSYPQQARKSAELNDKLLTWLLVPGVPVNFLFGLSLITGKLDACIKALDLDNYNKVKSFGVLLIINIMISIARKHYQEITNIKTEQSLNDVEKKIKSLQEELVSLDKAIERNNGIVSSFIKDISLRYINFMKDLNKVFHDNGYSICLLDAVRETEEWKAGLKENNTYALYSFLTTMLFTQPGDEDAKRLIQRNLGIREHIGVDYNKGTLFTGTIELSGEQSVDFYKHYYQEIDAYFNNNNKNPKNNCNFVFYGIPGVGKTQTVRNTINMLTIQRDDVTVFEISNAAIASLADVDSLQASIDEKLSKNRKIIIMIDEVDGIVVNRGDMKSDDSRNAIVNSFLQMIDGYAAKNVVLLTTTNYIDRVDDAFQRSGRFRRSELSLPNHEDRAKIIHAMLWEYCNKKEDSKGSDCYKRWFEESTDLFKKNNKYSDFTQENFLDTYSNLLAVLCAGHTQSSIIAIIHSFVKQLYWMDWAVLTLNAETENYESSEKDGYAGQPLAEFPTYRCFRVFMRLYNKTKISDNTQNKGFMGILKECVFNAVNRAENTKNMIEILQHQGKRLDEIYPGTIRQKDSLETYSFEAFDKIKPASLEKLFKKLPI